MRAIRAWWEIFRSIGTGMRAGRQADQIFRYFVVTALNDAGLFEFLEPPHSYGEILTRFEFEDSAYVQDILNVLVHDREHPLLKRDGQFITNAEFQMPDLKMILGQTDPRIRPMSMMAEAMSNNIVDRMRAERLGLQQVFEKDDFKVVNMFNQLLGSGIYSAIRKACFEFLPRSDMRWLRGRQLIDVGCGNGLETAEIWLLMGGETMITAVDAVPGMLELADQQFDALVKRIDAGHPQITIENRPKFNLGNAVDLPFEDNSFDAAFYSVMLHWTSDPGKAIHEMVRVVRPGGLVFGAQGYKPLINPYLDLVIRSSRNSYGAFWKDDYIRWFKEAGQQIELVTPAGIARVKVSK